MRNSFVNVRGKRYYIRNNVLILSKKEITSISEIEGLENQIDLKELDLSGNLIKEIKGLENLTELHSLDLKWNRINEIKGLETLTNLRILNLRVNQIKEIKGLEKLTELKKLDLIWNQIDELKGLESLSSLQILKLSENKIIKIKGLESLSSLQTLDLKWNRINKIENLDRLKNLKKLDLYYNKINMINGLEHLTKLHSLIIGSNQISKIKGLNKLIILQKLDLSQNQIRKIEGLNKLIELQTLDLGINQIPKIEGLKKLTKLQSLNLSQNQIRKIKGLDKLIELQTLDLGINQIQVIIGLNCLKNLKKLDLYNNNIVKINGFETLTNLQSLELRKNQIKKIHHIINLLTLPQLQKLQFDFDKIENQRIIKEQIFQHYLKYFKRKISNPPESPHIWWIIKDYYDELINIANILMNFFPTELEKIDFFQENLREIFTKRIQLESQNSVRYYEFLALEQIIVAGFKMDPTNRIIHLEKAIEYFELAKRQQCSDFYKLNIMILKLLMVSEEQELNRIKNDIYKIKQRLKQNETHQLSTTLEKIFKNIEMIGLNLNTYRKNPEFCSFVMQDCSQLCQNMVTDLLPNIEIKYPAMFRIINQTMNNFQSYHSYSNKLVEKEQEIRIQNKNLRQKKDDLEDFFVQMELSLKNLAEKFKQYNNIENCIDEKYIKDWLRQFGDSNKIQLIFPLIENIEFYDRARMQGIYRELFREIAGGDNYSNLILTNLGNPYDSANIASYIVGDQGMSKGITSVQFYELFRLEDVKKKKIIFIDDNIGSGKQVVTIFQELLDINEKELNEERHPPLLPSQIAQLKTFNLNFIFCVGHQEGKEFLKNKLTEFNLKIDKVILFNEQNKYGCFHKSSGIYPSKFLRENAQNLCEEIGLSILSNKKEWDKAKKKERALGYGNSQKLNVFFYNVPTTTLTLLWKKGIYKEKEWHPLFPRREKIWIDQTKNSKN